MTRKITILVWLLALSTILTACSLNQQETEEPQGETAATSMEVPDTPSSNELIETGLENGEIDEETALTYKVFALFSDPRLPAQYAGSRGPGTDSHLIDEVQAGFLSLSPETQQELLPFMMPPAYKGSWADPNAGKDPSQGQEALSRYAEFGLPCNEINSEQWEYKSAMHSPVRFWWSTLWPGEEQVANAMITAMDDEIWPKLTTLMGHTPLPDGNAPCNGGSADFDVYLTPLLSAGGLTPSDAPPGCRETPAFIVLNSSEKPSTLAHEFMHAIQWSYNTSVDCMYPGDYAWLAEATATWAEDYTYPGENSEHTFIQYFYDPGTTPTLPLYQPKAFHQYGAYLFFFYLTNTFGQPEIVSRAWANTSAAASVEAVDLAIPGGFEEVWGDFAIKNIIEPPEDDYQVWDNLNTKPSGISLIQHAASPNNSYDLTPSLSPLTIYYEHFTFSEDSSLVTFFNGLSFAMDEEPIEAMMGVMPIEDGTTQYKFTQQAEEDIRGLKIQAYFRVQGDTDWQLEDWTNEKYMSFCRDASEERLTDLIIVISNSSKDANIAMDGSYGPQVQVSDIGCWRYDGQATFTMTGVGENGAFTDEQVIPNVTFERTQTHPNIPYPILHFRVLEGQVDRTYEIESDDPGCYGIDQMSATLGGEMFSDLHILYGAISGPSVRRYSGFANIDESIQTNIACPDGTFSSTIPSQPWLFLDVLSQVLEKIYTVPNGGVLAGGDNLLKDAENAEMNYTWHFEPFVEASGSEDSALEGSGSSGQGNTSGGDGSVPSSPGTVDMGEVPPYPNTSSAEQSQSGVLLIKTGDAMEDVAEFYKAAYVRMGWTEESPPPDPEGEMIQLLFAKEKKITMIMISEQDGETTILITQVGG